MAQLEQIHETVNVPWWDSEDDRCTGEFSKYVQAI